MNLLNSPARRRPFLSIDTVIISVNLRSGNTVSIWPLWGSGNSDRTWLGRHVRKALHGIITCDSQDNREFLFRRNNRDKTRMPTYRTVPVVLQGVSSTGLLSNKAVVIFL
ncbi:MAG: hypothetical protein FD169_1379 [Bacillota bacterium]|nr:MAG: hypothetical protein FD169_1379 [Bacillota bacterium]